MSAPVPAVPVPAPAELPTAVVVALWVSIAVTVAYAAYVLVLRKKSRDLMVFVVAVAIAFLLLSVADACVRELVSVPVDERNQDEFVAELTEAIEDTWAVSVAGGDVTDVWGGRLEDGSAECTTYNDAELVVVCDGFEPPRR